MIKTTSELTGKEKHRMAGSCKGEYTGEGYFVLKRYLTASEHLFGLL